MDGKPALKRPVASATLPTNHVLGKQGLPPHVILICGKNLCIYFHFHYCIYYFRFYSPTFTYLSLGGAASGVEHALPEPSECTLY